MQIPFRLRILYYQCLYRYRTQSLQNQTSWTTINCLIIHDNFQAAHVKVYLPAGNANTIRGSMGFKLFNCFWIYLQLYITVLLTLFFFGLKIGFHCRFRIFVGKNFIIPDQREKKLKFVIKCCNFVDMRDECWWLETFSTEQRCLLFYASRERV